MITLLRDCGMARMMTERAAELNRAFSANEIFFTQHPGALPQAHGECCSLAAEQIQSPATNDTGIATGRCAGSFSAESDPVCRFFVFPASVRQPRARQGLFRCLPRRLK